MRGDCEYFGAGEMVGGRIGGRHPRSRQCLGSLRALVTGVVEVTMCDDRRWRPNQLERGHRIYTGLVIGIKYVQRSTYSVRL